MDQPHAWARPLGAGFELVGDFGRDVLLLDDLVAVGLAADDSLDVHVLVAGREDEMTGPIFRTDEYSSDVSETCSSTNRRRTRTRTP